MLVAARAAHAETAVTPVDEAWDRALASDLARSVSSGGLWFPLLAAWAGGLLTSFTPCVYPLIPITVRYFGGMKARGRGRVVRLAAIYVGGMVMLYAAIGTTFAATGTLFGSFLSSPWVVSGIAILCVAMGLSMLGLFTIQLPTAWNTKLSQVGGQSAGGALAMGLVSGLIAAPCTGPILAVILAVIAKTGAIFFGFWLMVAFGLGLGLPFLVLAIFSGSLQKLPSGGTIPDVVKTILAVAMFVVAIYFLNIAWPGLHTAAQVIPFGELGGLILILIGLTVGAFFLNAPDGLAHKSLQGLCVVLLTAGVTVGMFSGKTTSIDSGVPSIDWMTSYDAGMTKARSSSMPVMIDFTADWCAACKELDRETYIDEKVRAEATRFVSLKLDATEMDEAMEALFEEYGILGLPSVIFIDSQGKTLEAPRVTGFMPPEEFLHVMGAVH